MLTVALAWPAYQDTALIPVLACVDKTPSAELGIISLSVFAIKAMMEILSLSVLE